jgi:hypothetical protein
MIILDRFKDNPYALSSRFSFLGDIFFFWVAGSYFVFCLFYMYYFVPSSTTDEARSAGDDQQGSQTLN